MGALQGRRKGRGSESTPPSLSSTTSTVAQADSSASEPVIHVSGGDVWRASGVRSLGY